MSSRLRPLADGLLASLGLAALLSASLPQPGAAAVRPRFVEGEALVCFKPGVTQDQAATVLRRQRVTVLHQFALDHLYRVRLRRGVLTGAGIRAMGLETDVAFCQPNFLYHAHRTVPNDPFFGFQWPWDNTGQEQGTADADIDAPEAWDLTQGSRDVLVGVIDTGVDYTHPDLAANIWTNPGETPGNGLDDDGNGYVDDVHGWDAADDDADPQDEDSHGTHVAGTIGAVGDNGVGVTGVNWRVSLVPLRFLDANGSGTTADAIECIDYLNQLKDRGFNVVASNNSWGGGVFERALQDAIIRANARSILFVTAAGNAGNNNDRVIEYPGGYNLENVLSVTATDRNDRLAEFSNFGLTQVDLGAPGVEILSTVPLWVDPELPYRFFSGTSMAAPHVTGAAALLKAHEPSLSPAQVRERLLNTGDPLVSLQGSTVTGRRLNVFQALTASTPPPPVEPELNPQLTVNARYRIGNTALLRVRVTDPVTRRPVGGVTARFVVQTARGNVYTTEAVTNATGVAIVRFRLRPLDGRGTYLVTVGVTRTGYSRGSDSAAFLVR